MSSEFLKAYSVKEVSEKIDVPSGTLRQWERDFEGVLHVPRDKSNARYYTEFEIQVLKNIRDMRDKNLSKVIIREMLERKDRDSGDENESTGTYLDVPQMQQSEAVEALRSIQDMPKVMEKLFDSKIEEMEKAFSKENEEKERMLLENARLLEKIESEREENEVLLSELKKEKEKGFFSRLFKM